LEVRDFWADGKKVKIMDLIEYNAMAKRELDLLGLAQVQKETILKKDQKIIEFTNEQDRLMRELQLMREAKETSESRAISLGNLEGNVTDMAKMIQDLNRKLDSRDKELSAQKTKLTNSNEEVLAWVASCNNLRGTLAEKDLVISEKEDLINQLILEKQAEAGKYGEIIHNLEKELTAKIEIINNVRPELEDQEALRRSLRQVEEN
jgi:hypothetical protein